MPWPIGHRTPPPNLVRSTNFWAPAVHVTSILSYSHQERGVFQAFACQPCHGRCDHGCDGCFGFAGAADEDDAEVTEVEEAVVAFFAGVNFTVGAAFAIGTFAPFPGAVPGVPNALAVRNISCIVGPDGVEDEEAPLALGPPPVIAADRPPAPAEPSITPKTSAIAR